MALKNLSLASGRGCHQSKLSTLQWISRNLFTRKFSQLSLPIFNKLIPNVSREKTKERINLFVLNQMSCYILNYIFLCT
uniref:Nudix hydrolase 26ic-like n=1 Tax=Rhizophora mucronata TaxID=61149 RepID=A0A2P2KU77_RHIMU